VRALLSLPPGAAPYEINADLTQGDRSIAIVTRSVLAILSNLGAEITVPRGDVEGGATKPAIALVGGEARPVVIIHAAKRIDGSAYATVSYRATRFWIDDRDFDSKYALTVVQDLMALAEEHDNSPAPVVTVPAN
jgi:hypothetical protein